MRGKFTCLSLCVLVIACSVKKEQHSDAFMEKFRPQFHFSPPDQWMNDPNGMFYYQGEYHLFYQYYPDSNVWGPMHWGHAVSLDLIHWEHLPIAIYPDSLGYIFSGSAVVDWKNTSGFGDAASPPIVAIYTYHDPEGERNGREDFQYQGIAYSVDKGRTWTKYDQNPVLNNPGIRDFRDPKVTWYEPGKRWIMTLAVKDHVNFYSSSDLKSWRFESEFGHQLGTHAGVWECPDLFEMNVKGTMQPMWVLLVSINPGGPQRGSATQYFVGNFDGSSFSVDSNFEKDVQKSEDVEQAVWLDYGADNYAGVTWSDVPRLDGRRLFLGWMSNWQYAQVVPTNEWRSAMTLPRSLQLVSADSTYRIHSRPVIELNELMGEVMEIGESAPDSTFYLEIDVQGSFQLSLSNGLGEKVVIELDGNEFRIDRGQSGIVDFHDKFGAIHKFALGTKEIRKMQVFVDLSSIEIFLNDGEFVLTTLIFPNEPYQNIRLDGDADPLYMRSMASIWN